MLSKRFIDGCLTPFFIALFLLPSILILLREKVSLREGIRYILECISDECDNPDRLYRLDYIFLKAC